jgi:galactose mutarotase-like enzyme
MTFTPLETIVLASKDVRVALAPERGGMATRFIVGERSVFYLDEATLLDGTKNVRGGNPVLFPSPGKLDHDRYTRGNDSGAMGQHGFARNLPWQVVAQTESTVTLRLSANETTRGMYPWDFVATYHYSVDGAVLRIEQQVENTGAAVMPFGAGFHPYFRVPQETKARTSIPTRARRAWDNAKKEMVSLDGPIDLTAAEVDLHLVDHRDSTMTLDLGDGHRIEVRASEAFTRWVIWTLGGRDFVCVEPWTSPGNALNTGEGLILVPPGSRVDLWTEIAFR